MWFRSKPDLSHLRELRSRAFVLIQSTHNPKIFNCSIECILLSYSDNSKAYWCYHHESSQIIISCNVRFIERNDSLPRTLQPGHIVNADPPNYSPPSHLSPIPHLPSHLPITPVPTSEIPSTILPLSTPNPPSPTDSTTPATSTLPKCISKPSECLAYSRSLPYTTLLEQAVTDSMASHNRICALGHQPTITEIPDVDAPPSLVNPDDPDVPMMMVVVEEIGDEPRT
ncbi:hypothetical protein EW146_g9458 [Bondarzewia mesenterica]|uniref:Retroviral polymerase SH3-like domain-containing protein n=1 Tax=Bondarzewia mesenterica TaxID=1095465 RepID=A0A4S4L6D2_9AGAM|nr:hypothetical protein EW146_g9458 [Bondarzewia mesenterica]